jgi:hypothetical protein
MHKLLRAGHGRARWSAAATAAATLAALGTATLGTGSAMAAAPVAAPAAALGAALAAGPLLPGGPVTGTDCSSSTGCDLFAKAGNATVGGVALPVWNFTDGGGTVTGANAVIVASAGDTLTIRVHNTLAVPVALSIPGLPMKPDYTGAGSGGTATYTVTIPTDRAGTYLYQAGHLKAAGDPAAREVAMGLAGALVVRPQGAPGQAIGATVPASAFDDEAVLVLSEVDPAFAAAPLTYDLRNFHGTYRLINGSAWPETSQIATAANHRVLLRYVNAGVTNASMGAIGLKQSVLALDGYASTGDALVADTIPAGSTEDALVTVPAGGGNFVVADSTGGLNTNGQVDATTNPGGTAPVTRQIAFGGRMTVLSTTGGIGVQVDPGGDTVGPVTSAVSVAPTPVSGSADATVTATFTDGQVVVGANVYGPNDVTDAELFIDVAGAVGSGIHFAVTAGNPVTASATILADTLAHLTGPTHQLLVHGMDAAGNWGSLVAVPLPVSNTGPLVKGLSVVPSVTNGGVDVTLSATGDDTASGGSIVAMGYALDGTCTLAPSNTCAPLALTTGTPAVRAATATIPKADVLSLQEGVRTVTVYALSSGGLTGSATVPLTVDKTPPSASGGAVSPNPTNGTLGDPVDPTSLKVSATFADVTSGNVTSNLVAAEGFLDSAGADGTGFVMVASDGAFSGPSEPAYGLIPLTEVTALADGDHIVNVHAKDAAGNWGALTPITFTVDRTRPTVTGLSATQQAGGPGRVQVAFTVGNPGTGATAIVGAEYFLGTTDPGAGNGTAIPGAAVGANTLTLQNLPVGNQTVFVRVKDAAGNWSAPVSTSLLVYLEPIFSDTFGNATNGNNGNSNAWAARTTGSNAPTYPRGGLSGVPSMNTRFVMRTANNSGASNVTTPTMNGTGNPATATYYARFLFQPGTLSVANNVNIVTLRSNTTQRAAIQYRVNAGNRQIRAVTNGSSATGAWYPLPGGANATYTVQLTWRAGTTGSLVVLVNGVTASTATGGANNQTVNNAVLGTSSASGSVSGQAYFDYYTASRLALPQ